MNVSVLRRRTCSWLRLILKEGRGMSVDTSLKLLSVGRHVKLQAFQAEETSLLFVRAAGPHGFIYITR